MQTVYVEPIENHHALRVVSGRHVEPKEIQAVMEEITHYLDVCDRPLSVVLVLHKHVRLPMSHTVLHTLPVYQDERLVSWLVVAGNEMMRAVESTLYHMTRRDNVYWFNTEADALAHLHEQQTTS